ncbi:hypothetical protein [Nonomuraea sp. SBT364]|uniref:hypothetical protein n=1 Tax=Nonomuraea sp. SBT364 TaxID=1580530 RepID=UPI0012E16DDE|nr:hypothetical protein [Nonomuraea sp. SBT364]
MTSIVLDQLVKPRQPWLRRDLWGGRDVGAEHAEQAAHLGERGADVRRDVGGFQAFFTSALF